MAILIFLLTARIIKPDLVKMSGSVEVSTSGAWAPLETPGVATSSSDLANENNLLPQSKNHDIINFVFEQMNKNLFLKR